MVELRVRTQLPFLDVRRCVVGHLPGRRIRLLPVLVLVLVAARVDV